MSILKIPRPKPGAIRIALALALLVGGGVAASVAMHQKEEPAAPPDVPPLSTLNLKPRVPIGSSGFFPLLKSVDSWDRNTSLAEIATIWKEAPGKALAKFDRILNDHRFLPHQRLDAYLHKSALLNSEGQPRKAYDVITEARHVVEKDPLWTKSALASLIYIQGVAALRMGENDNCVMCRGESSCIFPISPAAVHKNREGSTLAIHHFNEYLEAFPDDLEARWLLNLAHMTLGEYPQKVNPRYLVNISCFEKSEFDIGKFRDVGYLAGVNRFNQAGGAIMEDFNNDGLLDIAVSSFDPTMSMALYLNNGQGKFVEQGAAAGLSDQLGGLQCVQTDYNNDGWMDIFVVRGAWLFSPIRPALLRNNGNGSFTDVTTEAGLAEPVNSASAAWADFDNDGWLDVFITAELQPSRLYRNLGNGKFQEVATNAPWHYSIQCKGASWFDFDNDRYPDLFLNYLNKDGAKLYHNNRDGTFTDVTTAMGIDGPQNGFSCWTWDYDNDGWLDIFATCYERTLNTIVQGIINEPNSGHYGRLYRNLQGKGFQDVTRKAGLDKVYSTMGSNFADFDNDGFLDLYLATGEPSFATLVPNRMFKNVGGLRFADITGTSRTGHLQKGHGVACGDWNRDGSVDLFVETGGAVNGDKFHNVLFQNPGQGNHWLTVKLKGERSNRAAIGARIKAVTSGTEPRTIHRVITSGSSFGANALEVTIGLGRVEQVATLEIDWPTSQIRQVFHDLTVDQSIEIVESAKTFKKLDSKPIPLPVDKQSPMQRK